MSLDQPFFKDFFDGFAQQTGNSFFSDFGNKIAPTTASKGNVGSLRGGRAGGLGMQSSLSQQSTIPARQANSSSYEYSHNSSFSSQGGMGGGPALDRGGYGGPGPGPGPGGQASPRFPNHGTSPMSLQHQQQMQQHHQHSPQHTPTGPGCHTHSPHSPHSPQLHPPQPQQQQPPMHMANHQPPYQPPSPHQQQHSPTGHRPGPPPTGPHLQGLPPGAGPQAPPHQPQPPHQGGFYSPPSGSPHGPGSFPQGAGQDSTAVAAQPQYQANSGSLPPAHHSPRNAPAAPPQGYELPPRRPVEPQPPPQLATGPPAPAVAPVPAPPAPAAPTPAFSVPPMPQRDQTPPSLSPVSQPRPSTPSDPVFDHRSGNYPTPDICPTLHPQNQGSHGDEPPKWSAPPPNMAPPRPDPSVSPPLARRGETPPIPNLHLEGLRQHEQQLHQQQERDRQEVLMRQHHQGGELLQLPSPTLTDSTSSLSTAPPPPPVDVSTIDTATISSEQTPRSQPEGDTQLELPQRNYEYSRPPIDSIETLRMRRPPPTLEEITQAHDNTPGLPPVPPVPTSRTPSPGGEVALSSNHPHDPARGAAGVDTQCSNASSEMITHEERGHITIPVPPSKRPPPPHPSEVPPVPHGRFEPSARHPYVPAAAYQLQRGDAYSPPPRAVSPVSSPTTSPRGDQHQPPSKPGDVITSVPQPPPPPVRQEEPAASESKLDGEQPQPPPQFPEQESWMGPGQLPPQKPPSSGYKSAFAPETVDSEFGPDLDQSSLRGLIKRGDEISEGSVWSIAGNTTATASVSTAASKRQTPTLPEPTTGQISPQPSLSTEGSLSPAPSSPAVPPPLRAVPPGISDISAQYSPLADPGTPMSFKNLTMTSTQPPCTPMSPLDGSPRSHALPPQWEQPRTPGSLPPPPSSNEPPPDAAQPQHPPGGEQPPRQDRMEPASPQTPQTGGPPPTPSTVTPLPATTSGPSTDSEGDTTSYELSQASALSATSSSQRPLPDGESSEAPSIADF